MEPGSPLPDRTRVLLDRLSASPWVLDIDRCGFRGSIREQRGKSAGFPSGREKPPVPRRSVSVWGNISRTDSGAGPERKPIKRSPTSTQVERTGLWAPKTGLGPQRKGLRHGWTPRIDSRCPPRDRISPRPAGAPRPAWTRRRFRGRPRPERPAAGRPCGGPRHLLAAARGAQAGSRPRRPRSAPCTSTRRLVPPARPTVVALPKRRRPVRRRRSRLGPPCRRAAGATALARVLDPSPPLRT